MSDILGQRVAERSRKGYVKKKGRRHKKLHNIFSTIKQGPRKSQIKYSWNMSGQLPLFRPGSYVHASWCAVNFFRNPSGVCERERARESERCNFVNGRSRCDMGSPGVYLQQYVCETFHRQHITRQACNSFLCSSVCLCMSTRRN